MIGAFDLWTEAGGTLVAAALIPFYMGFLHLNLAQLLFYCAVAGTSLALGEHLRFCGFRRVAAVDFLIDMLLWGLLVLGVGLSSYLLALLLV